MTHPLNVPSPPFSPHNSLSCRHFTLSPLTPYPHLSPYRVGRAKLASPPYSPPSPPLTPLPYHPHSLSLSSPHLGGSHQASFRSPLTLPPSPHPLLSYHPPPPLLSLSSPHVGGSRQASFRSPLTLPPSPPPLLSYHPPPLSYPSPLLM